MILYLILSYASDKAKLMGVYKVAVKLRLCNEPIHKLAELASLIEKLDQIVEAHHFMEGNQGSGKLVVLP